MPHVHGPGWGLGTARGTFPLLRSSEVHQPGREKNAGRAYCATVRLHNSLIGTRRRRLLRPPPAPPSLAFRRLNSPLPLALHHRDPAESAFGRNRPIKVAERFEARAFVRPGHASEAPENVKHLSAAGPVAAG
jgi:hypothetical protein